MAKLSDILSKASNLWSYLAPEANNCSSGLEDGEIIFSKNNVCVHNCDGQHLPGYFTIRVHKFLAENENGQSEISTLILTWVPNTFIERHPKSINETPNNSPFRAISG